MTRRPRLELDVDRAVAGGRMLARHEGQVVLISGAVAGERVVAEIEREQRGVLFARTVEVLRADPARRDPGPDPSCGGLAYAHIQPARQRELKAEIVSDAFARIARLPLVAPPAVHVSPEDGYRMRLRVHMREGRIGSFREGTHEICPVALTRQASEACVAVVTQVEACLGASHVTRVEAIEIAENLDGSARVLHLDLAQGESLDAHVAAAVGALDGVTGVTKSAPWSPTVAALSGVPWVSDPVGAFAPLAPAPASGMPLRRHARAFFQANRFLTPGLVGAVLSRMPSSPVVDLYAGVGLFAIAAAASGWDRVTAVEGDPISAADLAANAAPLSPRLRVHHAPVEDALRARPAWRDATVIVDPPRTGMSRAALDGVTAARPRRVVYVSCDVATLARDARRLVDAGYRLGELEAFDLFPNTPHIEVLADFDALH
jgi:23S rRNA (uracil1939-C5)-methyltransferase